MKYKFIIKSTIIVALLLTMPNIYALICSGKNIIATYQNKTQYPIVIIENPGYESPNQIVHIIEPGEEVNSAEICDNFLDPKAKNAALGNCNMNVNLPGVGEVTSDPGNILKQCGEYRVQSRVEEKTVGFQNYKYFIFEIYQK